MGKILSCLLLLLFQQFAMADDICASLYEDPAERLRQVRNALLRLTNLNYNFDSLVLRHENNGQSQIVVLMFEKIDTKKSVIEMIKEEVDYIKANVLVAPKIENGTYPAIHSFLKVDSNIFNHRLPTKEVDITTTTKAKNIRNQETRMIKFFAGAVSFLPTTIFSAISFAADLPYKEYVIVAASFTSMVAFKYFSTAIQAHYDAKPLDAKREVDLNENRDVTSVYSYEVLNQIEKYATTTGAPNDIHVIVMPDSLLPSIQSHLDKFSQFKEIQP